MAKKNDYAQRAKIFIPFDTLKGFQEALREKEKVLVSKKRISQELKDEIAKVLIDLKKGDMVKAIYFKENEYISIQGIIASIDMVYKELSIVKTKILFDDILEIKKVY